MPPAARQRCNFPGCNRGPPDEDGVNDCYTTPEGLATRELVSQYLKEHVEMAHMLPIKALEAEERNILAQATLVKAEADKIRAKRPPDQQAATTASSTTSGPKTEKIPCPTIDEGVSEGDWGFFVAQWERYVNGTNISGTTATQQLWAACSTTLQKSLHNGRAGTVTDSTVLLDVIKSLAVKRRNNLVNIIELQGMGQHHDEKVNAFTARLNGKADLCDLVVDCPSPECNTSVSFKDKILMYQLIRGLADPEIQARILQAGAQVEVAPETRAGRDRKTEDRLKKSVVLQPGQGYYPPRCRVRRAQRLLASH